MSNFAVPIRRITEPVIDHPNADRLSIIKIGDFLTISSKLEDGTPRYKQGDYVAYIPEAAILPEWLLKRLDFWNEEENKGTLNGPEGNRLKALKLRGIVSQGMLYPCDGTLASSYEGGMRKYPVLKTERSEVDVMEYDDVAELLGIVKWEPPIPIHMAGQVMNAFGHLKKYDFENWQSIPDIFDEEDTVYATEKLHGTFCQIAFSKTQNDEAFGVGKNVLVSSKGVGGNGLAFKNVPENDGNLYVKTLRKLLDAGLEDRVKAFNENLAKAGEVPPLHIFGEIFGGSVQDLKYGLKEPQFRVFDIALGHNFLSYYDLEELIKFLGLAMVPVLYRGPFTEARMKELRDGKTTFGEANIREGIVIKTLNENVHPLHGRKIAKMVSPAYLLRKGDVTEYN